MQARTKYWLEHCEVPHGGHEVMMQWESMLHDEVFLKTIAWTFGILAFIGLVVLIAITAPANAPLTREMFPYNYYMFR